MIFSVHIPLRENLAGARTAFPIPVRVFQAKLAETVAIKAGNLKDGSPRDEKDVDVQKKIMQSRENHEKHLARSRWFSLLLLANVENEWSKYGADKCGSTIQDWV